MGFLSPRGCRLSVQGGNTQICAQPLALSALCHLLMEGLYPSSTKKRSKLCVCRFILGHFTPELCILNIFAPIGCPSRDALDIRQVMELTWTWIKTVSACWVHGLMDNHIMKEHDWKMNTFDRQKEKEGWWQKLMFKLLKINTPSGLAAFNEFGDPI